MENIHEEIILTDSAKEVLKEKVNQVIKQFKAFIVNLEANGTMIVSSSFNTIVTKDNHDAFVIDYRNIDGDIQIDTELTTINGIKYKFTEINMNNDEQEESDIEKNDEEGDNKEDQPKINIEIKEEVNNSRRKRRISESVKEAFFCLK